MMPVVRAELITFVQSSRPPIPTSRMTTSTCAERKYRNAISVRKRKNPGQFAMYSGRFWLILLSNPYLANLDLLELVPYNVKVLQIDISRDFRSVDTEALT